MPGPYDRSGNQRPPVSNITTNDDAHAFLTPNGYRIMQDRNRVMNSVPVALPQHPTYVVDVAEGSTMGNRVVDGVTIDGQELIDEQELEEPIPQNLLPSKKYPNPLVLGNTPMTSHYKSSLVKNPQSSQLRAIGKLLIQVSADASREPATGSAWIGGPSLIVTSAHNVYEFSTGTWSHAIEFHPGFDYYSRQQLPTCRVTSCCIPQGYLQNPTTNHDIAVCFVDTNIGDIVDAQIPMRPVQSNDLFDTTPVAIVGYPAGSGFDFGKQLWRSTGDYLFGRSNGPGDDYSPVMATNFGGGSSGCPWLIKDPKTNKLISIGVTSAHAKLRYRKGEPNLMSLTSPFFGDKLFDNLGNNHVFHEFSKA